MTLLFCKTCVQPSRLASVVMFSLNDKAATVIQPSDRKEFALSVGENSVHGSDSIENAKTEISQFFSEPEIVG